MLTPHACALVLGGLQRLHDSPCLTADWPVHVLHREAHTARESLKAQLRHLPPDFQGPKANKWSSLLDVSRHRNRMCPCMAPSDGREGDSP